MLSVVSCKPSLLLAHTVSHHRAHGESSTGMSGTGDTGNVPVPDPAPAVGHSSLSFGESPASSGPAPG